MVLANPSYVLNLPVDIHRHISRFFIHPFDEIRLYRQDIIMRTIISEVRNEITLLRMFSPFPNRTSILHLLEDALDDIYMLTDHLYDGMRIDKLLLFFVSERHETRGAPIQEFIIELESKMKRIKLN